MIGNNTRIGIRGAATVLLLACTGGGVSMTHAQDENAWIDANTILHDGRTYRAVDEEGVFFWDIEAHGGGSSLPHASGDPRRVRGGVVPTPVRVRLVDFIDATGTSHSFNETPWHPDQRTIPPSRILNIDGRDYRVTASPSGFDLHWFSFEFTSEARPGDPHLMVVETVNDRERYTGVGITALEEWISNHPADGKGHWVPRDWAPPYETAWMECIPKTQEGDWGIIRDVGVSVYTGREYPVDGQPFHFGLLFYPKADRNRVTFSCSGWAKPDHPDNGAAVSRIWIFAVDDPVESHPADPAMPGAGGERRVGIYMTHPWYFLGHYGIPSCRREHRIASLTSLIRHLRFCGMNWLEFNAINGSDRTGIAWYEGSAYFPMLQGDLLDELSGVAFAEGVGVVPVVTSLLGVSLPAEAYQIQADGTSRRRSFGADAPDPLHPAAQQVMLDLIHEIGSRIRGRPAFKGIGFRVNGKIGLCYIASEDGTQGARTSGYSQWNLQQFRADTGIDVPLAAGQAYPWLQARPAEWTAWLDWRCARTREFWLRLRDAVRSHGPDLQLYVKCVLPSEVPGTNIESVNTAPHELLRHHGLDPLLFRNDGGIVLERTMMVAEDRFFRKWGSPWGTNADRYKTFHYNAGLAEIYRTAAGNAVELYHNYWEEPFHPDIEFGGFADGFRTHTPAARERAFFEPALFSLVEGSVDTLAFMGWERATLSQEANLRRFATAVRALPLAAPIPFDGVVSPPGIVARWYGDRLALFNNRIGDAEVEITFANPIPEGKVVRDAATGSVRKTGDDPDRARIDVFLRGYDLAVIDVGTAPVVPPPADPTRNGGFEEDGVSRAFPPRSWMGWGDDNPDGTLNGDEFGLGGTLFRPRTGAWCAGKYTDWGTTQSAGILQPLTVVPDRPYTCQAWGHTPGLPDARPLGQLRLGIDPGGGTDRNSASIAWTPWTSFPDAWTRFGFLEDNPVTPTGNMITLFLEYRQHTARPPNAMLFDDIAVVPVPLSGSALTTY
jgi:hypothetical protein